MSKVDISEQGALSLESLADSIKSSCAEIWDRSEELYKHIEDVEELGEYREQIREMLSDIAKTLKEKSEPINSLSEKIMKKAGDIRTLISFIDGNQDSSAGATSSGTNSSNMTRRQGNVQTAIDVMVNNNVQTADFGNLDARTVGELVAAIEETQKEFPELQLSFVGSTQRRNELIREDIYKQYADSFKRYYPQMSDADIKRLASLKTNEFMNQVDQNGNKIFEVGTGEMAVAFFSKHSALNKFDGITINEMYGNDYDYFKRVRENDVRLGWKPVGCDTPKATMDHELGHRLAYLTKAAENPEIQDWFNAFKAKSRNEQSNILSGYATTDIDEFIAEAWSEYRNNPNCRPCASEISKIVISLYEDRDPKKKVLTYPRR